MVPGGGKGTSIQHFDKILREHYSNQEIGGEHCCVLEADEHFQCCQGDRLGCVRDPRTDTVPAPSIQACAFAIERCSRVPPFRNAPGLDHGLGLRRDAVLEATNQMFDLQGAHVGARQLEGHKVSEQRLPGGQPMARGVRIALKQLECAAKNAAYAYEPIRLIRLESTGFLSTRKGTWWELDQLGDRGRGKACVPLEPLERTI
jgi:hypothetical protein